MAVVQIISPRQLSTLVEIVYTVPTNRNTSVSLITFNNTSPNDVSINVFYVPSGGSAFDGTNFIKDEFIAAGENIAPRELAHVLSAGSTIRMSASQASSVTVVGSGSEVSI